MGKRARAFGPERSSGGTLHLRFRNPGIGLHALTPRWCPKFAASLGGKSFQRSPLPFCRKFFARRSPSSNPTLPPPCLVSDGKMEPVSLSGEQISRLANSDGIRRFHSALELQARMPTKQDGQTSLRRETFYNAFGHVERKEATSVPCSVPRPSCQDGKLQILLCPDGIPWSDHPSLARLRKILSFLP